MEGEPGLWLEKFRRLDSVRVKVWKSYDVGIEVEMHKIAKEIKYKLKY